MTEKSKPTLFLLGPPYTAERLAIFYKQLTGKDATEEGMQHLRAAAEHLERAKAEMEHGRPDKPK